MPDPVEMDEKPSRIAWWRRLVGPVLTLLTVAALVALYELDGGLANPGIPLIVAVAIGAYVGGYLAGFVSAAIALAFLGAYLTPADTPFRADLLARGEQARLAVLVGGITTMAVLGGTARRRIRQASHVLRRRQHAYSRGLIASIQDGLHVTAPDGRISEINPRFSELLGYSRDELVGQRPPYPFWPPAEEPLLRGTLRRALAGERLEADTTLRRRDGTLIPVILTRAPFLDGAGHVTGVVSTVKDVAERRRAQTALAESEERYRIITDTASDAIVTIDEQSRMLFVNRAAERVFGHPREDLLGRSLTMLMPEPMRARHLHGLQRYLASGDRSIPWQGIQLQGLHKNGATIPVEVSFGEAVRDGRRIFTGIIRDVTDRVSSQEALRRSELQLQQAQRMEAVGRLAGGIAHDFNNLLTAITGYTDLLLADVPVDSPLRPDLSEIRRTADRAAGLTRQLLAFSRSQVLEPRVLDLNKIVAGLEPMLQRIIGEDVQLVTLLETRLDRVKADPGQLEQVVMNLAVNARDAMPDGGLLTIETANVFLDESYAEQHLDLEPGHYVMLAVSDTGQGMDEATRTHLFEPFFTTKARGKGTGLGLATVYGIVTQSGGAIWVYSEPGNGSTFKIYLPLEATALDPPVAEPPPPVRSVGTETVLLVEDDAAVRALAREVLRRLGYIVLEAGSPSHAIAIAEDHVGPIDALLTDVVMPEMRGPELAARLGTIRPDAKVIYMSGYTGDAAVRHGLLEHGDAFLEKPFGPAALGKKMREVLDGAAPSRTSAESASKSDAAGLVTAGNDGGRSEVRAASDMAIPAATVTVARSADVVAADDTAWEAAEQAASASRESASG